MLGKGFFNVKPFNPNPYPDPVIINLSGAQKFEEDTVFMPGRYRIEVAPGVNSFRPNYSGSLTLTTNMEYVETFLQPFIVRAYCGSDGVYGVGLGGHGGTNPYSGIFKVNAIDARTINRNNYPHGIDVNHIFGAGGGNSRYYNSTSGTGPGTSFGGGPNCLGDGNISDYSDYGTGEYNMWSGAGSCLHILPVGGIFETDYIRAYHTTSVGSYMGGAYGGGLGSRDDYTSIGKFSSRGGNSPYGNGSANYYDSQTQTYIYEDTGIGGGGKPIIIDGNTYAGGGAAYFNGTIWQDASNFNVVYQKNGVKLPNAKSSYIRITYLGPLNEEVYYAWGEYPSVKEPRVFTKNLNPQVGDQAWFFDFNNSRTSYDIKDATQVTIQSSGTGVSPIVWVDNTGFYAIGTLGPATYTLNRMSNDDIIIKW